MSGPGVSYESGLAPVSGSGVVSFKYLDFLPPSEIWNLTNSTLLIYKTFQILQGGSLNQNEQLSFGVKFKFVTPTFCIIKILPS
jgi:hypothetical protein